MIPDGIYFAETEKERKAVEQLRFRRIIKELKIYHPNADYKRHRLSLPDDSLARILYIQESKEVVGCSRLYHISHANYLEYQQALFSPHLIHSLTPIEYTAILDMLLLERTTQTHYEELTIRMFRFALQSAAQMGVTLLFTTCRDSDAELYLSMGFRQYREYFNSLETGLLLPLVLLLSDVEHLRLIQSPLIGSYTVPRSHTQGIIREYLQPSPQLEMS